MKGINPLLCGVNVTGPEITPSVFLFWEGSIVCTLTCDGWIGTVLGSWIGTCWFVSCSWVRLLLGLVTGLVLSLVLVLVPSLPPRLIGI